MVMLIKPLCLALLVLARLSRRRRIKRARENEKKAISNAYLIPPAQ